jgi:hypothetical protein
MGDMLQNFGTQPKDMPPATMPMTGTQGE